MFAKLIAEIFRDYDTDGVPSSGARKPPKADIRAWGTTVEAMVPHRSILSSDFTGTNVNTAQPWFGTAQDALTVEASTAYEIDAQVVIARSAGTTSHTTGILFGGTATLTAIDALARASNASGNTLSAVSDIQITAATETVVTAANTSATENVCVSIKGILRVNGAGTLIPQFKFSAAPGGAPTIKRGSYFKATKIGAGSVTVVGNWA